MNSSKHNKAVLHINNGHSLQDKITQHSYR